VLGGFPSGITPSAGGAFSVAKLRSAPWTIRETVAARERQPVTAAEVQRRCRIIDRLSEQNLELARRAYDAWNRGDVDAVLAVCHPEFEYHASGIFPGLDATYRGHEGFRKFERDFRATWESLSIDIERLEDHGDQVAVLGTFEAHGRDGMSVRRPAANVVTIRDGLAVRIDAYGEWDRALEAIGEGAARGSTTK
jgi:ketosteroid isomerase-like protein